METIHRLQLLGQEMHLEADSEVECHSPIQEGEIPITEAVMPNGQRIKLLKTMITSACERNCYYCPFRAGRDMRRATFTPDELAKTFMKLYYAKVVEGLFLSSGLISGGIKTQDKIIAAAELLRYKFDYKGYIHGKIMPGAERDQVERILGLANRVSVNLEGPNSDRLALLAPKKVFIDELLKPLKWVKEIRENKPPYKTWNGRWASSTTQFVVGAVGESDLELVSTSEKLFKNLGLRRIYYSGFNPVPDTPLENIPPINPWRQHRLYQSSYLLRDYGFTLEEMPFNKAGNLPIETDPKSVWAETNLKHNPIEINQAKREMLLRIPGLGTTGVEKILNARRIRKLSNLNQLKNLGIVVKRLAPFILLDGKRPEYQHKLL